MATKRLLHNGHFDACLRTTEIQRQLPQHESIIREDVESLHSETMLKRNVMSCPVKHCAVIGRLRQRQGHNRKIRRSGPTTPNQIRLMGDETLARIEINHRKIRDLQLKIEGDNPSPFFGIWAHRLKRPKAAEDPDLWGIET